MGSTTTVQVLYIIPSTESIPWNKLYLPSRARMAQMRSWGSRLFNSLLIDWVWCTERTCWVTFQRRFLFPWYHKCHPEYSFFVSGVRGFPVHINRENFHTATHNASIPIDLAFQYSEKGILIHKTPRSSRTFNPSRHILFHRIVVGRKMRRTSLSMRTGMEGLL